MDSKRFLALPVVVNLPEIARVVRIHEASAEDDASVVTAAPPEVRQIDCVKRIPAGKTNRFESLLFHRLGENRERELRLGTTGKSCEFESQGIGGEEDFPGRALRAACVNNSMTDSMSDSMNDGALLPFDLCNRVAFDNGGAAFVCHPREASHEFPGSSVPPGTFFTTRKVPESFH
jgi:hypothetical protein